MICALPTVGEALGTNARLFPDRIGVRDLTRSLTFRHWNERARRLANALLGLGLEKGNRVAILAYNCVEWAEIYMALAKAGLVAVPVNFRLKGAEIRYIVEDAEARAFIVQDDLAGEVEAIREDLPVKPEAYIGFGRTSHPGYRNYEALIAAASDSEPAVRVAPDDAWALMYTSGTTGRPKGAIRTHASMALLAVITAFEQGFTRQDAGLLVMPLCHSNSLWYATLLVYCGAGAIIYDRRSFDPEHLLRTFSAERPTFTSLVPTHYVMLLGLAPPVRAQHSVASLDKLLISSAPARRETKAAVMEWFSKARLYEGYGSTEAGWVTVLHPHEQFEKLGSIGKEVVGSRRIRLLDDHGDDVAEGEVGEMHSCTPYPFKEYWNLPEKTAAAFRDGYCTVGDMARRDAEGYYYLADRKNNMIISGGENVYPSEVESLLASHPAVGNVAVIGIPHDKWGESVCAVIVPAAGRSPSVAEILDWCKERIAGYKRPRRVVFISEEDMPRTATGKIQHRILRERYARLEETSCP